MTSKETPRKLELSHLRPFLLAMNYKVKTHAKTVHYRTSPQHSTLSPGGREGSLALPKQGRCKCAETQPAIGTCNKRQDRLYKIQWAHDRAWVRLEGGAFQRGRSQRKICANVKNDESRFHSCALVVVLKWINSVLLCIASTDGNSFLGMWELQHGCWVRSALHRLGICPPSPRVITNKAKLKWKLIALTDCGRLHLLNPALAQSTCLLSVSLRSGGQTFESKPEQASYPPHTEPAVSPCPAPSQVESKWEDGCFSSILIIEKQSLTPTDLRPRFSISLARRSLRGWHISRLVVSQWRGRGCLYDSTACPLPKSGLLFFIRWGNDCVFTWMHKSSNMDALLFLSL